MAAALNEGSMANDRVLNQYYQHVLSHVYKHTHTRVYIPAKYNSISVSFLFHLLTGF